MVVVVVVVVVLLLLLLLHLLCLHKGGIAQDRPSVTREGDDRYVRRGPGGAVSMGTAGYERGKDVSEELPSDVHRDAVCLLTKQSRSLYASSPTVSPCPASLQ
ncbi:hypothetical protein M406DRAFT_332193 [Cryphonectria parasitica EP155]|uniref:Secreted protein n=1 Tax=Cryphonectria parasitica (strain ATCC 38755 / EP155) TaxID=660469 RepID=A0A9P5CM45_CRYP1|nr:uncharacterized protein M406DRAFT_332193 [Cryphonectria parasitica EP155]KAF3763743.1 hypothetical protein M406DRAFT_332193 [Cryphonectria parasitica EP155]